MGAAVGLRSLHDLIDRVDADKKAAPVGPDDLRGVVIPRLEQLVKAFGDVGARSALAVVYRLLEASKADMPAFNYVLLQEKLRDIESRFADHLDFITLFVLNEQETTLLAPAQNLLSFDGKPVVAFTEAYPNAAFEIEEAAKCYALGRHTASVFHCMRTLEYGIRALSKFLDIPDPTKGAERNWAVMLKQISDAMDERWPKGKRMPNSEGAKIEALYSHLDAVRNPWRNTVMHVEYVYPPHDALHIARCTGFFILALSKHCNEAGEPAVT